MADRKAKDGAPKPASAKARAATPRKTQKASGALPVKTIESAKAAETPAPKVVAERAPAPLKAATVKRVAKPAAPAPLPVVEAVEPPAPVEIEVPAVAEPIAVAAEETVTNIQESVKEGIDTMDAKTTETLAAGKTAADQMQAMFGDINERAKGAMEKNAKIVQEVTDLAKGNVEAIVTSGRVAAKGVESLSREAAEYSRKSFEDASAALKSFAEVRTPADLFRLQSDYARSYFDSVVAESSKLSEAFVKLAGEVAEPITSRYSVAAERVRTLAL